MSKVSKRLPSRIAVCGLVLVAALAGAWSPRVLAQQPPAGGSDVEVVQVRPDFYLIAGLGSNIALQIGSLGVVLVDTGLEQNADRVLAEIKRLTSGPIRYIINTSADPDHVGGNDHLSRSGLTIHSGAIGQRGIGADVLSNGGAASVLAHENVLARMSAPTGSNAPFALWPTKTFSNSRYSMYLNDDGIQVLHQPGAHTDGDSVVFFRRADVIVTGDIIDLSRFPVIDVAKGGSIQGEIDALNRILDLVIPPFPLVWQDARTLVVPGHGRLMDHADVVEYRDMATIVRDTVQDMINRGLSLEQIKAANPVKPYRTMYGAAGGSWTADMFVEAVYKSLTAKRSAGTQPATQG
jgi:cyclase